MEDCIFCRIIKGEIPSTKVFENDSVLAFLDINPVAPVHIVVVSKQHISSVAAIDSSNSMVVSKIFEAIAIIAREQNLTEGYRVVSNIGPAAGQTVPHLHFHLLGGKTMSLTLC